MAIVAIVTSARLAAPRRISSIGVTLLGSDAVIKGIKFVGVPVSDQQRALDFYTKQLGFRVITDQPFDDTQRWIELGIGRSGAGIALFTPEAHRDRIGTFTGISFVADDVRSEEHTSELQSRVDI